MTNEIVTNVVDLKNKPVKLDVKDACKDCVHFIRGQVNKDTLESTTNCTRFPPQSVVVPSPQGIAVMSVFPSVSPNSFCGEFEPLEEPPF